MKANDNQSWADRELKVYKPCASALQKARKYPDPQSAWDAWNNANELFWTLIRLRASTDRMLLCSIALITPLIDPMRLLMSPQRLRRRTGAIDAVYEWANDPQTENRQKIYYFSNLICGSRRLWPLDRAVEKLLHAADRPHKLYDLPKIVKAGVFEAVLRGWKRPFIKDVDNACLTQKKYERWQCKIVRDFFPITPFIKAYY